MYGPGNPNYRFSFKHKWDHTFPLSIRCYHDGASHFYEALTPITIDTIHRLEVKWDSTNNVWAWRFDGVDQPNNIDDSDPITSEGTLTATHETQINHMYCGLSNQAFAATMYYDLYAIDDADWVGVEPVGQEYTLTNLRSPIHVEVPEVAATTFFHVLSARDPFHTKTVRIVPLGFASIFQAFKNIHTQIGVLPKLGMLRILNVLYAIHTHITTKTKLLFKIGIRSMHSLHTQIPVVPKLFFKHGIKMMIPAADTDHRICADGRS